MTREMLDRLTVRWGDRTVGELAVDRSGAMRFAYAAAWIEDRDTPPVSMRLPKQEDPFGDRIAKPFFYGLLPEEWQREAAARAINISPGNPFRLLKALRGDTAGALTFWPGGGAGHAEDADTDAAAEALGDDALAQLFDRMAQKPMLAGEGRRYSLAGAQSKLPVVLDGDGRVALARPGQATTHIIKPEPVRFAGLAAN